MQQIREQKNYTQFYMATKMGKSQSTYSRMEKGEAPCTMKELQQIADILETDISAFLDSSKITIQNQSNNECANGYVENLHIENKETTQKLIQTLEKEIEHLKKEIEFLRSIVKN